MARGHGVHLRGRVPDGDAVLLFAGSAISKKLIASGAEALLL
jgi:hypothetical protein